MDTLRKKKKIGRGRKFPFSSETETLFRVWAPNADKVSVIGDFNDWDEERYFLQPNEKGEWSLRLQHTKIGQGYKFVIHNGDQKLYKYDPYAREISKENNNSILSDSSFSWTDTNFRMADKNKLVIYQLDVGTFFHRKGYDFADLKDVDKQLCYLKILGINAIEIIASSKFSDSKEWAYNPSRAMGMCREYGGAAAIKNLVNVAHNYGITVIMGVDFSHFDTSDVNLWQFDGWSENGKGGIYFYNDDRAHTPWGDTRPDYGRYEVRKFIRDSIFRWLENFHCDGVCMANTDFVRHTSAYTGEGQMLEDGIWLLREINGEIKTKYPDKLLLAQELRYDASVTAPIVDGGLGFDAQRNPTFIRSICQVLQMTDDNDRCMQSIVDALEFRSGGNPFERVIYSESQCCMDDDNSRLPEKIHPGQADTQFARKRATLAAVLTLTAPGIPMFFQGQELLIHHYFIKEAELDWDTFAQCEGISKLFADLIKYRKSNYPDFAGLQGEGIDFLHFNQKDQVLAYQRIHRDRPKCRLVVVINFSKKDYKNYTLGLPSNGLWKLIFNSSSKKYDRSYCNLPVTDFNAVEKPFERHGHSGTFGLPCYSALMFINRN